MSAQDKKIKELTNKVSLTAEEAVNLFFAATLNSVDFKIAANILNPSIGQALSVNGVFSDIVVTVTKSPDRATLTCNSGPTVFYQINGTSYSIAIDAYTYVALPNPAKNYTICLTTDETLIAVDKDFNFVNDAYDYIPIAFVPSSALNNVKTDTSGDSINGYQEIAGIKYFTTRVLDKQASAQAAAENLVIGTGRAFALNTTGYQLKTILSNGWTGGSFIFLDVLAGQQIANNAPDWGATLWKGILLNCGTDWVATENTTLLLKYDSVKGKWIEVGGTSIASGTSGTSGSGEITHERVYITAADVTARSKTITLLYSIAPETHVFVDYCQSPLSRNTIGGAFSYTEKAQTVTVNFDNTVDFGFENKYEPKIGDEIVIKYTKYLPIPTPEVGAYVNSVTGTASGIAANFDINVLPDDADTTALVHWTLYNSASVLIDSGSFSINTAESRHSYLYFPNLANETYTLTAWVDVGEEEHDDVVILATAAKFQKVALTYRRSSATTIEVIQTMKNIGDAAGDFGLYLTLENTVPTQVGISPLITKTIAIGATSAYVYEFTGVSSIEYDAYSKCEATIYLYNVAGDYYTII